MKKWLIFVHDIYEDMELHYPRYRLLEAGFEVHVAGPEKGAVYKGKYGYPMKSDLAFSDVAPTEYAGLIIPGGFAPDKLRQIPEVLQIVQEFDRAQKCIAFICHGGWVPISAKVVKGRHVTGYAAIRDDLTNAGAIWHDKEVVIDGHMVSARKPHDLPAFMKAILGGV